MRRIGTTTAETDLFGTGASGFTDGSAIDMTPPTALNADWFNNVQEEICQAVLGSGGSLIPEGTDYYFQLDDAIQTAGGMHGSAVNHVVTGLVFNISGTSLTVSLSSGEYYYSERRYVVTDEKLSAANADSFTLTASRDTYFFIGPVNPAIAEDALDRGQVYITTVAVANGAATPATPTGTFAFAMVVTNGTDATTVTYFSRGPRMIDENGQYVALRPSGQVYSRSAFHPNPVVVCDLGYSTVDSQQGYWSREYVGERHLRSQSSSLYTHADDYELTFFTAVGAGATVDSSSILTATDWPEGTVALVEIRSVVIVPTSVDRAIVQIARCMVRLESGIWEMDGTGGDAPTYQQGSTGIVGGLLGDFHLDGTNTQLLYRMAGDGSNASRWFNACRVTMLGD